MVKIRGINTIQNTQIIIKLFTYYISKTTMSNKNNTI